MTNLEQLRKKIIKYVPEKAGGVVCVISNEFDEYGREVNLWTKNKDITSGDVLTALIKQNGDIRFLKKKEEDILNNVLKVWKPDEPLREQSEETIKTLNKLIK